jgi:hypothetical protein
VYSGPFLFEQHPDLGWLLGEKPSAGCQVCIAVGDNPAPPCPSGAKRSAWGRHRLTSALADQAPLVSRDGSLAEVVLDRTTLYNSI